MEKKHPLGARGKVLEDLFYFEKDLTLLEKKQQLRDLERNLKTYAEISGITNEAILRKLAELQVRVETLATLSVIPLVEVAWADGKIDDPEREAILKEAESCGVFPGPGHPQPVRAQLDQTSAQGTARVLDFLHAGVERLARKKRARGAQVGFSAAGPKNRRSGKRRRKKPKRGFRAARKKCSAGSSRLSSR